MMLKIFNKVINLYKNLISLINKRDINSFILLIILNKNFEKKYLLIILNYI